MQRYSTQRELEVCILMTANPPDGHLAPQTSFFQVVFVFVTEFSLAPLAQLAPLRSP
jgi:hypothetical protein